MPSSNEEELTKRIEREQEKTRSLLSGAESRKEIVTLVTKEYLVPIIEQDDWIDEYEPAEEEIDTARRALAKEYLELGIPLVQSTMFLLVVIGVADYLFSFPAQVYGILFSLWAAPVSIFSSLRGPGVLATITGDSNEEAEMKVEAQSHVTANLALVILSIGFILQFYAVAVMQRPEFLSEGIATSLLPNWAGAVSLILCFVVTLGFMNRVRKSGLRGLVRSLIPI